MTISSTNVVKFFHDNKKAIGGAMAAGFVLHQVGMSLCSPTPQPQSFLDWMFPSQPTAFQALCNKGCTWVQATSSVGIGVLSAGICGIYQALRQAASPVIIPEDGSPTPVTQPLIEPVAGLEEEIRQNLCSQIKLLQFIANTHVITDFRYCGDPHTPPKTALFFLGETHTDNYHRAINSELVENLTESAGIENVIAIEGYTSAQQSRDLLASQLPQLFLSGKTHFRATGWDLSDPRIDALMCLCQAVSFMLDAAIFELNAQHVSFDRLSVIFSHVFALHDSNFIKGVFQCIGPELDSKYRKLRNDYQTHTKNRSPINSQNKIINLYNLLKTLINESINFLDEDLIQQEFPARQQSMGDLFTREVTSETAPGLKKRIFVIAGSRHLVEDDQTTTERDLSSHLNNLNCFYAILIPREIDRSSFQDVDMRSHPEIYAALDRLITIREGSNHSFASESVVFINQLYPHLAPDFQPSQPEGPSIISFGFVDDLQHKMKDIESRLGHLTFPKA